MDWGIVGNLLGDKIHEVIINRQAYLEVRLREKRMPRIMKTGRALWGVTPYFIDIQEKDEKY